MLLGIERGSFEMSYYLFLIKIASAVKAVTAIHTNCGPAAPHYSLSRLGPAQAGRTAAAATGGLPGCALSPPRRPPPAQQPPRPGQLPVTRTRNFSPRPARAGQLAGGSDSAGSEDSEMMPVAVPVGHVRKK